MLDFAAEPQSPILLAGDVMLDRYLNGVPHRISPEAPVVVLRYHNERSSAGGAANVAANITALGGCCTLLGAVGADAAGEELKTLLEHTPNCHAELLPARHKTVVKLRIMANNHHQLRMDFGEDEYGTEAQRIQDRFAHLLDGHDTVVFSDYAKGSLEHITNMLRQLPEKMVSIVDPKGKDFERYRGASVLTPNQHEFRAIVGDFHSQAQMDEKALHLLKHLRLGTLIVTLGAEGVALYDQSGVYRIAAQSCAVCDVAGAGDTFVACLAVFMNRGWPIVAAAELAVRAATLVVAKPGTACVSPQELTLQIQDLCRHNPYMRRLCAADSR